MTRLLVVLAALETDRDRDLSRVGGFPGSAHGDLPRRAFGDKRA